MNLKNVIFLDVSDVEAVHASGLEVGGGSAGLRDMGLLESAVMAPRVGYYSTLAELAAVYAFGIAKNHAFVDGNKRAALGAAVIFLDVNGYALTVERETWRRLIEGLAAGDVTREELAQRLALEMGDSVTLED